MSLWIAKNRPESVVVGVDAARRAVARAREHARLLAINNASFAVAEESVTASFPECEILVECQTLQYLPTEGMVSAILRSARGLVSVPHLMDADEVEQHCRRVEAHGLSLTDARVAFSSDCGRGTFRPILVFSRDTSEKSRPDVQLLVAKARRRGESAVIHPLSAWSDVHERRPASAD
ncbi:MAG: hypothetical protein IPF47_12575 [Gemmatimonadetes bacterium]|nr:hypothetical protein [Gemmatimonadota bacterium]